MSRPKIVRKRISLNLYDLLDGTLGSLAKEVAELVSKYGEAALIDLCVWSSDVELELTYERPETKEEREKRLKTARARKERDLEAKLKAKDGRLETLKKLAKEFGVDLKR